MKRIKQLFASDLALRSLEASLAAQRQLKAQVRKLLPAPIDEQIESAILHSRTLTLWVNSPVWASRLRYLAPQLLRQLKQEGLILDRIQPRIQLLNTAKIAKRAVGRKAHLSHQSAEALRHAAECQEDQSLKAALLRLSRHAGISRSD